MVNAPIKHLLPDSSEHITANLSYYTPPANGDVPWVKQFPDPAFKGKGLPSNVVPQEIERPIYDLRPLFEEGREAETDINLTGFQLVPKNISSTSMKYEDWDDQDKIAELYYPEVEALIKKVTGADRVVIFDNTVRKAEAEGAETPDTPDNRKPVARVHVDQTPESGRNRVIRHTGDDAERLLRGRAQLINLWRPLRGPVLDVPLAFADARTLNKSDLVPSRLIYPDREGQTFQVAYSEDQRWYYLSNMQPDEAVLLKCWDNGDLSDMVITPHTAFEDPRYFGKPDVPLRQSIEIRALVFHEPKDE